MNYVKSLAKQLGPKGIRVNAVAPGPIWTPLQVSGGASMEKLEKFGSKTPLGRAGQPAELASSAIGGGGREFRDRPGLWFIGRLRPTLSYATGRYFGLGSMRHFAGFSSLPARLSRTALPRARATFNTSS